MHDLQAKIMVSTCGREIMRNTSLIPKSINPQIFDLEKQERIVRNQAFKTNGTKHVTEKLD
jgi:S-adenosylmethionine/arginine decarboxylase-like enzyme